MSPEYKVFVALLVHGGGFFVVCGIMLALQWAADAICRIRGTMTLSGRRKAKVFADTYFGCEVLVHVKGDFCYAQLGQAVIVFDTDGNVISLPSDQCKQTEILESL